MMNGLCYTGFGEAKWMDLRKTGELIRRLRLEKHLTQMALSEKIGASAQAVSKWERGVSHS